MNIQLLQHILKKIKYKTAIVIFQNENKDKPFKTSFCACFMVKICH